MPKPSTKKPVILPSQERSRVTFEIILEATTYLMEEIGIQNITTNKIAERAGVNINSIYQYFLDKNTIIRVIAERVMEKSEVAFARALIDSKTMENREKALTVIKDLLQHLTSRPRLHREILFNMPLIIGPERQEIIRQRLAEKLVGVIPDEFYPSEKTKKMASEMMVHAFLNGALLLLSPDLSIQDQKLMSDELRHLLLRYIGINELSPRNYRDYFFYIPSAHDTFSDPA